MVRDLELPFLNYKKMTRCQLKFLLYILTKQDGDTKTKWWPDNIRFELPITNRSDISKETLTDLFKSYYKFNGDSDWLRAIIYYVENLVLNNETDFTSIDISGKISHKGVEFDIVPSLKNVKTAKPVTKKKKISILNKSKDTTFNISPAVIKHFNSNLLEDKSNIKLDMAKININKVETDQDTKLCIKESHIRRMMPVASVQLCDVVKYEKKYSKEDFLLTLNLMKTDVLSKLNLLKFRKRLRNTSRDSNKSASEFEKELSKFRSKPNNKEVLKDQKQKGHNKKTKIKEKDKIETKTNIPECMITDNIPHEVKVVDNETNKENKNEGSSNTPLNTPSTPKTLPFQVKSTISENIDCIIDLTLDDSPKKITKEPNNLYNFLNISPIKTPTVEKQEKIKQSPPKGVKRLNRNSMSLLNQNNIMSYFSPIPMRLSPELLANKLEELRKVCRPCFVRLDFVKDLKPIRSITKKSDNENNCKIERALPLPIPVEESIIDLTNDEDDNENEIVVTQKCLEQDEVEHEPKNLNIQKRKNIIKIKWPTKRLTL